MLAAICRVLRDGTSDDVLGGGGGARLLGGGRMGTGFGSGFGFDDGLGCGGGGEIVGLWPPSRATTHNVIHPSSFISA